MNRHKKEQRRKDKRVAKQVAMRKKEVEPLIGQYLDEKTAHRCPECGASPRVPMTCKLARREDPETHDEWDLNTNKTPHTHLVCSACGAIGYLVKQEER